MTDKKWNELTRSDLIELSKKMNGPQIAKTFNVHHNTVYARFAVLGISAGRRKFNPDPKELAEKYLRMSMADIAKEYGVGETVVFKRLKEHGIGGITRSDRLSGKPKTLEHRLAMSVSAIKSGIRGGEKNGNWRGGKTSENLRGRSKTAYHEWKHSVFSKANWKCQECGREHSSICECCGTRTILHAHHIKSYSEFPELRYEVSNGKALCERCHMLEHHNKIG